MPNNTTFSSTKYELLLFSSLEEMVEQISRREDQFQLSRLVAGYSWPWASKNDSSLTDIQIGEVALRWNSVNEDWVNSANAKNEVGCIHTTQGYDLNYTGLIFGNEISYDEVSKQIVIDKSKYHDRNGKTGLENEEQLKSYIINIYKTLMLRGIKGTYLYVCDDKLRKYFSEHIATAGSESRSEFPGAELDSLPRIPIYDLRAAAGSFSDGQTPVELRLIPLPSQFRFSEDLFACTVVGRSMDRIIPENSVCLFRRYSGGSRNGKIVLVELDDLQDPDSGSKFTVKEYRSTKSQSEDGWEHESITLKPISTSNIYQDLRLEGSEIGRFTVVGTFEAVLYKVDTIDSEGTI